MSLKTRDKIITAAKPLFNEEGFGAPSLYQLSQQLGMSRGNLTYYFKDKEVIYSGDRDQLIDWLNGISAGRLKVSRATGKRMFKAEWIDCFMLGK